MTSATREEFANSATQNRELTAESAHAAFSAPAEARPAPGAADIDVNMDEPADPVPASSMIQVASKPNQPAATVMFESGAAMDAPLARMERPSPEPEPAASESSEEVAEPEPPAPSSRPTPTRSKLKSKPLPKKGTKARSGKAGGWSTASEEPEEPKSSSSKTPMIVALAVALAALIGAGVYFLRGKSEPTAKEPTKTDEPTPAAAEPAPSEEPAALAPKPAPAKPAPAPAEKPARAEKSAPAEKPARAEKSAIAEKPARAEKSATAEKPKAEPAAPEPKAAGGKPSEEDFRRANEAYERGNTKLFQGKTADAIAEFSQALKLNPRDPAIHRGLGLAYAQSGKSAEATKHLKLYLKASPKATDRAIIEKRIDQLHGH
jgi:hypothetical protein